ncbi:MAG: YihY/virulence factor BrkB family protein [Actinomycetota bacterium]
MAWKERLNEKTKLIVRWSRKATQRAGRLYGHLAQRYGFIAVIDQAIRNFFRHGMSLHAGNFAYSAFLAIFPLFLLIAAVIGFIFSYNSDVMQKVTEAIRNVLPDMPSTVNAASESLVRLRNVVGILGIIGLLWTISKITYAIQTGFEEVWETYKRSFVKKKLFAFGVMFLLLLVGIVGLAVTFVSSQFFSWLNRETGPVLSTLAVVFGALLSPLASTLIFAVLYRRIPLVRPGWKEVLWGAITAALLLDAAEYGLGIYFTKISKNQALYGSLGVVLGIVLWLYVVGILIFLGAEIVHVLQLRWETGGGGMDEPQGVQLKLPREDV